MYTAVEETNIEAILAVTNTTELVVEMHISIPFSFSLSEIQEL